MIIHCTKKLLDQLQVKPVTDVENEDIYSWHANLLMINRKKIVVLVNNQNRYTIILNGLKAKDFKKFHEIAIQGIRETFRLEGIKEDVIEKYLQQAEQISFAKTKNRTYVARMNNSAENVYYFEDHLDNNTIFNSALSVKISSLLVGDGKNSYVNPNEEMYKALENLAHEKIFSTKAIQLKVTLKLNKHKVWREIIVPLHLTFEQLHEVIQHTFGWGEYHLHEFFIYDFDTPNEQSSNYRTPYLYKGSSPIVNIVCDIEALDFPNEGVKRILEKGLRLSDYLPKYSTLIYNYDFGDDWQHVITVEKMIEDYDKPYPICLKGAGKTPPEDVGGEGGYEEFLKILADPTHPEHQYMTQWGKSQGYCEFDIESVNRDLKNL